MPRGDRTGPAGMGPMTGRGAGFCAGYGTAGYMNNAGTYGGGRGFGGRRGFGRCFGGFFQGAQLNQGVQRTTEDEKYELNARSHSLAIELELIQKRLKELGGEE